MVATPRKVAPNKTADSRAGTTPLTSAGRAIPAAWIRSAAHSRLDRVQRRLRRAHAAEAGTAASPVSTQAPLPAQAGEFSLIAATRKVPAMM